MGQVNDTSIEVKEYLMSIVGNSPFGILAIDLSGYITIINQTLLDYMGLEGNIHTYIDKPFLTIVKGMKELSSKIKECISSGRKPFDIEELLFKKHIFAIKGRIVLNGMMITLQDITKTKEAEKRLMERTRQLEKSNKELEQFAYISSHDLQEPLKTVISFVELFSKKFGETINDDAKNYLHYISMSTNRMSQQIKSLLEYSRIGRTKKKKTVNCNTIVHNVVKDIATLTENIKINFDIPELPQVKAFEPELNSLFQNLVSNAVKFRKKDTETQIKIHAAVEGSHWKFALEDNGIGIAKEHKDKIFIIFQRLHTRDEYEGTGIGLAQCAKIVEMHGGEIWVESEINKGSTFYFTIKK